MRAKRTIGAIHEMGRSLGLIYQYYAHSSRSYDSERISVDGRQCLVGDVVNAEAK